MNDYETIKALVAALRESMEGHCPDTRYFCGSCDKGRKLLRSMGEMWTFMPPKEPIFKSHGEGK